MFDLFSSEYGWTPDYIGGLTFMQQHFYLVAIMDRRRAEAEEADDAESFDDAPLLSSADEVMAAMGM